MATVTTTFGLTGGWQTYNVPNGVTSVSVDCRGASSGVSQGGRVTGVLGGIDGNDTLYIVAGEGGNLGVSGGSGSHTNAGGVATWGQGGPGGAGYNDDGGTSGAGYSGIRVNATDGPLKCVAGGAGGKSGDGGKGGEGGGSTGGTGSRGNAGSGAATGATGGTQSSGGNAGTSSSGSTFNGSNASDSVVARGGQGGDTGGLDGPGGGGGGGGLRSGGGGAAGSSGFAPGTGGGGGSNYTGGLSSASSTQSYNTGNGTVIITYTVPLPAIPVITNPSPGERTRSTSITFSATTSDPNNHPTLVQFRYDTDPAFGSYQYINTATRSSPGSVSATVSGLPVNTHYYVRAYSYEDTYNLYSSSYDSADFYTNYRPNTPSIILPAVGARTRSGTSIFVSATVSDPDGGNASGKLRALFRYSTDPNFGTYTDIFSGYVANNGTATATLTGLSPNTHYYLRVYGHDDLHYSSAFDTSDFYTNFAPDAPTLLFPADGATLLGSLTQEFDWDFNDVDPSDFQSKADYQYREYASGDPWTVILLPGMTVGQVFVNPPAFASGKTYEWQVRAYDSDGLVSPWAPSRLFSTVKELRNGVRAGFRTGAPALPKRGLGL